MSRKKDMDRKVSRQSGATCRPSRATSAGDLPVDNEARKANKKITRVRFLSNKGGKRSPETAPQGGGPEEPACDAAPANETQLERKRRLNRNNERKKRAKRIHRIEDLTSKFHTLTSENEALKEEAKDLKEKIASVKKYMEQKGIQAAVVGCEVDDGRGMASPQSSTLNRMLGVQGTGMSSPVATSLGAAPPGSPRSSLATASTSGSASSGTQSQGETQSVDLSFIPREQRIRLLTQEFAKQERILGQLRGLPGTTESAAAAAATVPTPQVTLNDADQVQALIMQATAALCPAPAHPVAATPLASASPQVNPPQQIVNEQEQIQALLRQLPASTAMIGMPTLSLPPLQPNPSLDFLSQLQTRLSSQSPASMASTFSSTSTASDGGAADAGTLLQQQLLLLLGAFQN